MEFHNLSHILQTAIEQSNNSIIITSSELDPPGPEIVYVNNAFERMTGYMREEVIGSTPRILQGPATDRIVLDRLRKTLRSGNPFQDISWNYRKDGSLYKVEWSIAPICLDGERVQYYVSVQREVEEDTQSHIELVSETRRLNTLLNSAEGHQVSTTGALNYRGMLLHLQNLIDNSKDRYPVTGIVALHLRRLDRVDQAYGVEAINKLLSDIFDRLNSCLKENESLIRSHEHTFSAIVPADTDAEDDPDIYLLARARVFVAAIREGAFKIEGNSFQVEVGAGIARAPVDGCEAQELVTLARRAANTETDPVRWPDHTTMWAQRRQLALESKLQRAVTEKEIVLFYQPIVDLFCDEVVGVEALARWPQPDDQPQIGPDRFIPLAEELGLMERLGMQVFKDACHQLLCWQKASNNPAFWVSVNVAPSQLLDPSLADRFIAVTQAIGVPPTNVKLEITESALENSFEEVSHVINKLAAAGFPLALDDFGTGYSSLGRLIHMPFNIVKVDKSFVWQIPDGRGAGVVTSLSKLCNHLNLEALGEGVETVIQKDFLHDCNYRFAQGYHYAKPMAAADFAAWMGWKVD